VIGLQGSTRDIRERKRTEASLLESETRFRLLVDNAPDVIFVSTEQRFAYLNRAAVKLFGADSAEQILGRPVIERFHPDYHESVRRRIHKLYVEQEPVPRIEEVCLRWTDPPSQWKSPPFALSSGKNGAPLFSPGTSETANGRRNRSGPALTGSGPPSGASSR
jgi:PAS domain-containing protein